MVLPQIPLNGPREPLARNTLDALKNHYADLAAHGLPAPTITDFTNAQHDHGDSDDGGTLVAAALPAASGSAQGAESAAHFLRVEQLTIEDPWEVPTLDADWSDFDANNSAIEVKKDATGRVWIKGLAKKSSGLSYPDTICTLDVKFRPERQHIFPGVGSGEVFASIGITSAGVVALRGGGSATWTSLDGISFDPNT